MEFWVEELRNCVDENAPAFDHWCVQGQPSIVLKLSVQPSYGGDSLPVSHPGQNAKWFCMIQQLVGKKEESRTEREQQWIPENMRREVWRESREGNNEKENVGKV